MSSLRFRLVRRRRRAGWRRVRNARLLAGGSSHRGLGGSGPGRIVVLLAERHSWLGHGEGLRALRRRRRLRLGPHRHWIVMLCLRWLRRRLVLLLWRRLDGDHAGAATAIAQEPAEDEEEEEGAYDDAPSWSRAVSTERRDAGRLAGGGGDVPMPHLAPVERPHQRRRPYSSTQR